MKTLHAQLVPMTLAAGLVALPLLAFAQADGTPGNPPSTAVGRAIDRATGNPTIPDGAPGNPPGTAVGRAVDRLTGQPTSPDGTGNNPPGTALDRAARQSSTTTTPAAPAISAPAAAVLAATSGSVVIERPRLSQILGGNIYNERNERIGEVDDVILSAPSGETQGPIAVIQVGGFLGIGGKLVAVPLNDLRWSAEHSRIVMPGASKEALQARTPFDYNSLRRG